VLEHDLKKAKTLSDKERRELLRLLEKLAA
jgi:hypothetical protein